MQMLMEANLLQAYKMLGDGSSRSKADSSDCH